MLVKDENKYCWCEDEFIGEPQNSIKDAVADYLEQNECLLDGCDIESIEIGHPYYYVPEVDGERVIWNIIDYDLDDELAEWSQDYMHNVKKEHIDELSEELTKVFQAWEKKHGYENTAMVVMETKKYRISDYINK